MITIALDAMGGDFGAEPIVTGAVQALYEKKGFRLILVGDRDEIEKHQPYHCEPNRQLYIQNSLFF